MENDDDLRDLSRRCCYKNQGTTTTWDLMKLGTLMRIAEALERIASRLAPTPQEEAVRKGRAEMDVRLAWRELAARTARSVETEIRRRVPRGGGHGTEAQRALVYAMTRAASRALLPDFLRRREWPDFPPDENAVRAAREFATTFNPADVDLAVLATTGKRRQALAAVMGDHRPAAGQGPAGEEGQAEGG